MRYLGGKFRQGPAIAARVMRFLEAKVGTMYIEPFCGALGSAIRVADAMWDRGLFCPVILSDVQPALITLWKAVLAGWMPPDVVTEEQYNRLKRAQDPKDPMTAFAGYGCAFAAKYFGTYARCDRYNHDMIQPYAKQAKHSILQKLESLKKIEPVLSLDCIDYRGYEDVQGAVIYMDPPYAGRTAQNSKIERFDSVAFWDFARRLSANNVVFVSEFIWPEDFVVVHSWGDTVVRHWGGQGSDGTCEALVCLRGSVGEEVKPK